MLCLDAKFNYEQFSLGEVLLLLYNLLIPIFLLCSVRCTFERLKLVVDGEYLKPQFFVSELIKIIFKGNIIELKKRAQNL